MLPVAFSALCLAAGAGAAALQPRDNFVCHHFLDQCTTGHSTIDAKGDDIHFVLSTNCTSAAGKQVESFLELNDCLGNEWGTLVSGGNFGYSCHDVTWTDDLPDAKFPFSIHCQNGEPYPDPDHPVDPVTTIDLNEVICADKTGVLRCQNQYDNHLGGL